MHHVLKREKKMIVKNSNVVASVLISVLLVTRGCHASAFRQIISLLTSTNSSELQNFDAASSSGETSTESMKPRTARLREPYPNRYYYPFSSRQRSWPFVSTPPPIKVPYPRVNVTVVCTRDIPSYLNETYPETKWWCVNKAPPSLKIPNLLSQVVQFLTILLIVSELIYV